ncbi:flagellar protein FlaG [Noviherbaspirillum denitrificans]|uniref:Flagellar biosynthesis protein FlaG n=1 Tax=Noviherbaspirillum denitrificans TaxID=1968433 RepID=A0A254TGK2_9BURK|nr:flagellar protein FlaG [Noviherbaspirillum denitrificans]OWW21297.1 hypothetical protein AYR66_19275 [Noviherbaspirillum denitrificans]
MRISTVSVEGYSPPANVAANPAPAAPVTSRPSAPVELPSKAVAATSELIKKEQLQDAANKLNKVVQTMTNGVEFTVDSETGIHVVKVIDTRTDEVIRQFPSEELVDLAKSLDRLQGLVIRQKA